MRGTMLWFNASKNFGFISTEEGERLYVHGTGFARGQKPEGRCAGRNVTFSVSDDDERQARKVVFDPDVVPQRARLRRGGYRGVRG